MEQIDLKTWDEFEAQLVGLRAKHAEADKSGLSSPSALLFRGLRDHSWSLDTTLERHHPAPRSFDQYFRLVSVVLPQIETFTQQHWEIPKYLQLREWARDYDSFGQTRIPGYDYFIYLRHHGFPSPLLDWTRSPYIAAYFAFAEACSTRVAIYCYWEDAGHGKSGSSDTPQIIGLGPYVRSHTRHFLQQSEYTVCSLFQEGEWCFAPHEVVFSVGSATQDRLWKFTIPASERLKALRILDAHNLNAFSIFQNEEALLKTMWLRESEFREMDL